MRPSAGGQPEQDICCEVSWEGNIVISLVIGTCGVLIYSIALGRLRRPRSCFSPTTRDRAAAAALLYLHVVFQVNPSCAHHLHEENQRCAEISHHAQNDCQVLSGMHEVVFLSGATQSRRERQADIEALCWADCTAGNAAWRGCPNANWPFEGTPSIAAAGLPGTDGCELPGAPVAEAAAMLCLRLFVNLFFFAVLRAFAHECYALCHDAPRVDSAVVFCPAEGPGCADGSAADQQLRGVAVNCPGDQGGDGGSCADGIQSLTTSTVVPTASWSETIVREDVVSFPDLVEPVEAFPSCPEIVPDTGWRIGEGHQGEIRTLAAPETCPDPSVPGMDQIQASAGAEGVGSGEHCARAWGDRGELVMEMTATPSMHASPPESLEEDPVVGGISAPQLCAGSLAVTAGTVPTRRGDALMLAFSQAAGVLARRGTVWLQPPSTARGPARGNAR